MKASRPTRYLISAVRGYQAMRFGRLSPCRFVPSCSEYAIEAIEVHGAPKGSWLAVRRICRCNPFGRYGSDPVPPSTRRVTTHIHNH